MSSLMVNQGLQRIAVNASQATGTGVTYSSSRYAQTMSIDDSSNAFAAGDTALNTGGAVTNEFDQILTAATVVRTNQSVAHQTVVPTGSGNFTTRRVAVHDDTAANVTTSSTTLMGGVDGQSLTKTSDFTMTPVLTFTYTSV